MLKSMKMSAEERKEADACCAPEGDSGPAYPYGLRIDLDDDVLEKLGMTTMPSVGTEVIIMAKARVVAASSYSREGSDPETSISMQITDMELGPAIGAAPSLYGA